MLRTRRTGINLDEYMRSQILEEQVTQLVTNGRQRVDRVKQKLI